MEGPVGGTPSHPSPWAEPPAFLMDLLVQRLFSSKLGGRTTVASLRLVSRRWRTAASAAVRAVAARCNDDSPLAGSVDHIFPHLQVLQLSEGGSLDAALGLAGTLKSLRLLGSHSTDTDYPVHFATPAALAQLMQLTGLVELELEAGWAHCCMAADHLTGLQELRSVALTPVAVSTHWTDWGDAKWKSGEGVVLLERCSRLPGLRRLACTAHGAQPQHVVALTSLPHLTALQLAGLPNEALPALAQLGSTLRSLSLVDEAEMRSCGSGQLDWDADSEGCTCTALPAGTFSQLRHLEASWDVLLAFLLPAPDAAAIPAGTLSSLTSLALDMGTIRLEDLDEDEELPAMEQRMELLPRWLFGIPTRLQRLRLHGASTFGGWPGDMLTKVSKLQVLEAVSLDYMHVDAAVMASLAHLPHLRELEIGVEDGTCWLWVAPLRACSGLTRLALAVKSDPMRVASEVAQLRHLRSLKLDGNTGTDASVMTRRALKRILTALPTLERLQTEWGPASDSDEAFCQRFAGRLLHSKFWRHCGPHWLHRYDPANFEAAAALADLVALLAE